MRKNSESHQRLKSRLQVPMSKTGIQYLESGIHNVESTIQDYPGFPLHGATLKTLYKAQDF